MIPGRRHTMEHHHPSTAVGGDISGPQIVRDRASGSPVGPEGPGPALPSTGLLSHRTQIVEFPVGTYSLSCWGRDCFWSALADDDFAARTLAQRHEAAEGRTM